MTVLGYDLFLVDALRRQLRLATDRLAAIRTDDPLAAPAIASVRDVQRMLELTWLPAVGAVLTHDPLGAAASNVDSWSVDSAPALGGPGRTVSARESIPDSVWVSAFDDLAARRLAIGQLLVDDPDDAGTRAELAALDRQIAEAALGYAAAAPSDGHVRWFPAALLDMSPFAAALVLRHLDLDDRVRASISALVLHRWREGGDHGERWPDSYVGGDNTADVLFRSLSERPAAATEFLRRVPPADLFLSAQFDDAVARLLLVGTSPDHCDEATAGTVLRPLLEWLRTNELPAVSDGVTTSAVAVTAAGTAPWLAALGPRATSWGWTFDDGDRTLRWLLDDPAARRSLADAMAVRQAQLADAPLLDADGRVDDTLLRELASSLAQVQVALRDAEIADATADALMTEMTVTTAGLIISAAVPGGAISVTADVGVALLTPVALSALDRWGVAPSAERSRAQAQSTLGDRAVDTAVIAIVGIVGAAIERGDLPSGTLDNLHLDDLRGDDLRGDSPCTPRETSDRLHEFIVGLEPITDAATHNALVAVLFAFANPLSDAQLCE